MSVQAQNLGGRLPLLDSEFSVYLITTRSMSLQPTCWPNFARTRGNVLRRLKALVSHAKGQTQ